MKIYIDRETSEYPVSEGAIRSRHIGMHFPTPFRPPARYAEVKQEEPPAYSTITHGIRELHPEEAQGEFRQTWEVFELSQEQVAENVEAAKSQLMADATNKRWEVMTGGMTLPGGIEVGTTIDDQSRITSVVANAALAGLTDADEVDFKATSGWVRITIAQIKAIAGAIGQFVQACYSAERAHHEAIAALETREQLNEYDVNTGWPE